MSKWLDPTGKSTYGLGVCARCWRKFSIDDLYSDPNSPGLKVCLNDIDDYDPYRLPARQTENIALRFNRPDEPVTDFGTNTSPLVSLLRTAGLDVRGTVEGERRQFIPLLPPIP